MFILKVTNKYRDYTRFYFLYLNYRLLNKKTRLNQMYPNMQTEKKIGQILQKILIKKSFVQTLMTYISLNIEVVTERVTNSESA